MIPKRPGLSWAGLGWAGGAGGAGIASRRGDHKVSYVGKVGNREVVGHGKVLFACTHVSALDST